MAWIEGLRGVILDVDGTLLDGDAAVPGAAEAVSRLRARRIPFRFVTNTTRRPRVAVADVVVRLEEVRADAVHLVDEREPLRRRSLARAFRRRMRLSNTPPASRRK